MRSEVFSRFHAPFPNAGGGILLSDLIDGLAADLLTHFSSNRSDEWGADDFVATLCLRDRLDRLQRDAPPTIRDELVIEVDRLDGMLVDLTEHDSDGLVLSRFGEPRDASSWWWRRIPKNEPARSEFIFDSV